jgi:hypothetical protein
MKTTPILLIFMGLFCLSGKAIITANNATAETDPYESKGFNWDYVYNYKNCSAVAVDPYWILTAAHVADDSGTGSLSIDGVTYTQQEIIYNDTADLALVRYDKALPGYYNLFTGTLQAFSTIMVGYGNTGTVTRTGQSYFYEDSGSGSGTKRWGSNQITSLYTETYNAGYVGTTTNSGFLMKFDAGGTEAGVGTYDSGGGTFAYVNGEWELVGINTLQLTTDSSQGLNYSYAISVSDYSSWITQTVPEPGPAVLFAGIGILFAVVKRIRYMYR